MIVNNKYNFIYVHIPKTGGCSTLNSLRNIKGTQHITPAHGSIKDYVDKLTFNFATIRNPFDWYVSFFSFKGSSWSNQLYDPEGTGNFSIWLDGILNLRCSRDHAMVVRERNNDPELDYRFHLDTLINGPKMDNAGWLTHLVLFSCCENYEEIIKQNDINETIRMFKDKSSINQFIATSDLNNISSIIDNEILKESFKSSKIQRLNKSNHSNSYKYYSEEMKKKVLEKDRLVFEIIEDCKYKPVEK